MKRIVQLDLWQTLVSGLPYDPIYKFQKIIGHRPNASNALGVDPDEKLLAACLTCGLTDPAAFAESVTATLGLSPVTDDQLKQFEELLVAERESVARYWDVDEGLQALRNAGFIVCLNSNLWGFAADHILYRHGLAKLFHDDGLVLSFREGFHKDQPESYMVAHRRFGVDPCNGVFVGDSLKNDCVGPMKLGIRPFLLDRAGNFESKNVPAGVTRIRNLVQLTEALVQ